jgi:hypothetical protein
MYEGMSHPDSVVKARKRYCWRGGARGGALVAVEGSAAISARVDSAALEALADASGRMGRSGGGGGGPRHNGCGGGA